MKPQKVLVGAFFSPTSVAAATWLWARVSSQGGRGRRWVRISQSSHRTTLALRYCLSFVHRHYSHLHVPLPLIWALRPVNRVPFLRCLLLAAADATFVLRSQSESRHEVKFSRLPFARLRSFFSKKFQLLPPPSTLRLWCAVSNERRRPSSRLSGLHQSGTGASHVFCSTLDVQTENQRSCYCCITRMALRVDLWIQNLSFADHHSCADE